MSDFLGHFRQQEQTRTTERIHPTQCPYCSMQCTMRLVEEKTPFATRWKATPNKDDPVVQGRMCVKGVEAHVHALDHQRLTQPLLRRNGDWVAISWEEALEWFRDRVEETQERYGKDAVGVYGGGSLTNEEAYLLGKFARVALQTRYIDYNGRFCMSSAATAANQALGVDRGLTNPLSDIPAASCIILAGANIAECQPTMMPYFRQAKANGATLIAIDPRETPTTRLADIHLPIRPGTDAALVNGMLRVVLEEGYADEAFLQRHTTGWPELKKWIESISLDEVAAMTAIPREKIEEAARAYGRAATGMVFTARGVEQHAHGVKNVRNFLNLVLVTGKIGRRGSGYGAVTGQGNGQGGREHGQKADQLPGYRRIDNPQHRREVAQVWGIGEEELPQAGVSAYEMFQRAWEGEIRGMVILSSNPVVSNPHVSLVEEALERLDFLVAIDLFLSETAEKADLILPGSAYLEDEGTMTNLEGRVIRRQAVQPLPGEARLDWQILAQMAQVLGKGRHFTFTSAQEIFAELRQASRGGIADYSGITYERIEKEGGVFWPCPEENAPGTARLFADGRFWHPDGRAKLTPVLHAQPPEPVCDSYPLTLTTGRVLSHYLTGVQTRRTPALLKKAPEPFLSVHPKTAERWKLEDGERVRVLSRRGQVEMKVELTPKIREDTVFAPIHWGGEGCINRLTLPELDPESRMPSFKICAVRLEPVVSHHSAREERSESDGETQKVGVGR